MRASHQLRTRMRARGYHSLADSARLILASPAAVQRWSREGYLPTVRADGLPFAHESDLRRAFEERVVGTSEVRRLAYPRIAAEQADRLLGRPLGACPPPTVREDGEVLAA